MESGSASGEARLTISHTNDDFLATSQKLARSGGAVPSRYSLICAKDRRSEHSRHVDPEASVQAQAIARE